MQVTVGPPATSVNVIFSWFALGPHPQRLPPLDSLRSLGALFPTFRYIPRIDSNMIGSYGNGQADH
jgi:hypothetical protein